eukprot:TRINITY_DN48586_c0_g1_i1.p1 TRINITY_DN48586_c0_g1~~TRINITY_DN48586_c0_g1_i1.p1  ORF type:complete len:598 (-),score=48.31 TRINITY_DN48586_c0_g1_i1:245-2038(-)
MVLFDIISPVFVALAQANNSIVQRGFNFQAVVARPYVVGTPGAEWSKEEARIVKAALFRLFSLKDKPLAPLALRLGFHDCLRYTDGTGGCDGCLNWKNMDQDHGWRGCPGNIGTSSDNRRLDKIVEKLEDIYTKNLTRDTLSLRNRGKSRADLWAFAALTAVEFGIFSNNEYCDNPGLFQKHDRVKPQCNVRQGENDCKVHLPRPFVFRAGRIDCKPTTSKPYIATKDEAGPNPQGNGQQTVAFFKTYFGFNGRDTVAIMGAHTFGSMHKKKGSCLAYSWSSRSEQLWNTQYYRNLAQKLDKYFLDDNCTRIDHNTTYSVSDVRMVVRAPLRRYVHATQWFLQKKLPRDEFFPKLMPGRTSSMSSPDAGLYFDFNVDGMGIAHGCPGMDARYESGECCNFEGNCAKNQFSEPPGSDPLYKIVEEFADSPSAWMGAFVPALERLQSIAQQGPNLYSDLSLTSVCDPGPNDGGRLQGKKWVCWYPDDMMRPIKIINRENGKALTMNSESGVVQLASWIGDTPQYWRWTTEGRQLINVKRNSPMGLHGQDIGRSGSWHHENSHLLVDGAPYIALCADNSRLTLRSKPNLHKSCEWDMTYV